MRWIFFSVAEDLDKMQREYCAMSLDEKRAFLAGSETTASEAEELLNFVR